MFANHNKNTEFLANLNKNTQMFANNNHKNSQHDRVTDLRYKLKYQKLKRRIKNFVFENAAMTDEIANIQGKLIYARNERRFLVKRLTSYESSTATTNTTQTTQPKQRKSSDKQKTTTTASATAASASASASGSGSGSVSSNAKNKKHINQSLKAAATTITTTNTITNTNTIPDPKENLKYPIRSRNLLIHSIGEILPVNPNFHTKEWIYPVGYAVTRSYAHPKHPQRKCIFTCKILNNSGLPQFQIIPDNDLDSVFFGDSARACHQRLLDSIQQTLAGSVKLPISIHGEMFFGLADSKVQMFLQKDSGIKFCANFCGFASVKHLNAYSENEDPTINFEALQSLIAISTYHSMPEVKEEPPDELFNLS